MPALWLSSLAGMLISLVSSLIGRVLLALGIGAVSYIGISAVISQLSGIAFANLGAVGGPAGQLLGLLNLSPAMSMLFSAGVIKMTLQGLSAGGSVYRWQQGMPS